MISVSSTWVDSSVTSSFSLGILRLARRRATGNAVARHHLIERYSRKGCLKVERELKELLEASEATVVGHHGPECGSPSSGHQRASLGSHRYTYN